MSRPVHRVLVGLVYRILVGLVYRVLVELPDTPATAPVLHSTHCIGYKYCSV